MVLHTNDQLNLQVQNTLYERINPTPIFFVDVETKKQFAECQGKPESQHPSLTKCNSIYTEG